jgi:hypothetical protein
MIARQVRGLLIGIALNAACDCVRLWFHAEAECRGAVEGTPGIGQTI